MKIITNTKLESHNLRLMLLNEIHQRVNNQKNSEGQEDEVRQDENIRNFDQEQAQKMKSGLEHLRKTIIQ